MKAGLKPDISEDENEDDDVYFILEICLKNWKSEFTDYEKKAFLISLISIDLLIQDISKMKSYPVKEDKSWTIAVTRG